MRSNHLVVVLLTVAACAQPQAGVPAVVDSIPFVLEDARIYVPVNGSAGPLGWFILDTGAQPSGVDVAVAERWQATALDSGMTTGAGGRRTRQSRIPGRVLRIGGVPFRTETLNVTPLDSLLGAVSGRVVSGLIGSRFFYDHTVTIDFDRRMLYLRPPGSVNAPLGSTTVPFELRNDVPFVSGTLTLPDGRTVDANYMIDIGAKATVLFSEPFLERHRVSESIRGPSFTSPLGAGIGGRTQYRFARVPEIRLGADSALRWSDVVVGLSVGGTLRPSYFDGLFGLEMLTRFIPTFDYRNSRMILAPRPNAPTLSEIDLSGLFLIEERSPRAIRVSAVVDSSPANQAGIEVGDELLTVDGQPVAAMSLAEVRDILRSRVGRAVSLTLRRAGTERTRSLTLRRMA